MAWKLEDVLRHYSLERLKLARRQPMPTDTQAGAADAPLGNNTRDEDPLRLLVQGYQKYLKRSGRSHDPITDALKLTPQGRGMRAVEQAPGELETGPGGQAFQVTQHGPRAGLVHQRYDLGDGLKANVYYDPSTGEREVVRFRSRRPPSKGAARLGSAGKGIIR